MRRINANSTRQLVNGHTRDNFSFSEQNIHDACRFAFEKRNPWRRGRTDLCQGSYVSSVSCHPWTELHSTCDGLCLLCWNEQTALWTKKSKSICQTLHGFKHSQPRTLGRHVFDNKLGKFSHEVLLTLKIFLNIPLSEALTSSRHYLNLWDPTKRHDYTSTTYLKVKATLIFPFHRFYLLFTMVSSSLKTCPIRTICAPHPIGLHMKQLSI